MEIVSLHGDSQLTPHLPQHRQTPLSVIHSQVALYGHCKLASEAVCVCVRALVCVWGVCVYVHVWGGTMYVTKIYAEHISKVVVSVLQLWVLRCHGHWCLLQLPPASEHTSCVYDAHRNIIEQTHTQQTYCSIKMSFQQLDYYMLKICSGISNRQ